MSEWQQLVTAARREGLPLKEAMRRASRAYRLANVHSYRNPADPRERHRHHRRQRLGALLSRGVPFREAQRLIDRSFDRGQGIERSLERDLVHPTRRNGSPFDPRGSHGIPNPTLRLPGRPLWWIIGGVAALAWWTRQQPPGTVSPAPTPATGPAMPPGATPPAPSAALAQATGQPVTAFGTTTIPVKTGLAQTLTPWGWTGAPIPNPSSLPPTNPWSVLS